LSNRISVVKKDVFETAYPAAWGSGLKIILSNGDKIQVETKQALGDPDLPLSPSRLVKKAEMLLTHAGLDNPGLLIDEILGMAENRPVPVLPLEECMQKNLPENMQ